MTRIEQEKRTVRQMIEIYCHGKKHERSRLLSFACHEPCRRVEICEECSTLLDYAYQRLDYCRFGEPTNEARPEPSLLGLWLAKRRKTVGQKKPICKKCPIHCYKPDMKRKMREVMRYAGPRMTWYHPIAAIRHLIREL